MDNPTLRILSLGAGIQSSTLALLAAEGAIEPPDAAIFADTSWEPPAVYRWLDQLETLLPFPVIRVNAVNLREQIFRWSGAGTARFVSLPFFTKDGGMVRRQCTRESKIDPIRKAVRELAGLKPRQRAAGKIRVEQWIGISCDEIERMSNARERWIHNRFPLIEMDMTRVDCIAWLQRRGFSTAPSNGAVHVPKSSCIGCPYHSNSAWAEMKRDDPVSFADAVEADAALRANGNAPGMRSAAFLHRSCKPLSEVDFGENDGQGDLFECEGACGT